jgi:hypothetical protein
MSLIPNNAPGKSRFVLLCCFVRLAIVPTTR